MSGEKEQDNKPAKYTYSIPRSEQYLSGSPRNINIFVVGGITD